MRKLWAKVKRAWDEYWHPPLYKIWPSLSQKDKDEILGLLGDLANIAKDISELPVAKNNPELGQKLTGAANLIRWTKNHYELAK